MKTAAELEQKLRRIDGAGYKAYKELRGEYQFPNFTFTVDHVQGDPFASPSRVRVRVTAEEAGFPAESMSTSSRKVGLRDFLTRLFAAAARDISRGQRGTGKGGVIEIDRPGQQILERTSFQLDGAGVEARFFMGLPAFGRRIAGRHAYEMIFDELPCIVERSCLFNNIDAARMFEHIECNEDADALRERLARDGLVAFVADRSVLPRASGVDDRPLTADEVIPFRSPESLSVKMGLPNRGTVAGMGIPKGVTLIVGGGYHGKSTLLNALEKGVYNHIPGDGRELVVTDKAAVKIRAEDGRRIEKVDIRPFISGLPFGKETGAFCSEDASGSTSQAANIMEALETGAETLLVDEDTSATNFMIRDHRMQCLVAKECEPITPFIDRVRQLYEDRGVSSVLVIGGSGDYFDVADRVICLVDYEPQEVTEQARQVARDNPIHRQSEAAGPFEWSAARCPVGASVDPRKGKRDASISAPARQTIAFGTSRIDLFGVEQIVDRAQTSAIGEALRYARRYMDGKTTTLELIEAVESDIEREGLDVLSPFVRGDLAAFRRFELLAALNRLRTLVVQGR